MEFFENESVICRLCGFTKHSNRIKCKINDRELNIEEKLIVCCRWKSYSDNEQYPKHVCTACFDFLEKCWKFAETVAATQQKFANSFEYLDVPITYVEDPSSQLVNEYIQPKEKSSIGDNSFDDRAMEDINDDEFDSDPIHIESNLLPEINMQSLFDKIKQPIVLLERLNETIIETSSQNPTLNGLENGTNETLEDSTTITSFIRPNQMKSHHKITISKEQITIFECYLCRSSYHRRHWLKKHMLRHIKLPLKIECNICHKFIDSKYYSKHYQYHSDIKPFSCSYCDKTFKEKKYLKIHERYHTGERPYKCRVETCDYRCADPGNIVKHMRKAHNIRFTKQKPVNGTDETLECSDKLFKIDFPNCLNEDEKNVDGTVKSEAIERLEMVDWSMYQYQCNECNLRFDNNIDLGWHYKDKHTHMKFRHRCWICTRHYSKRNILSDHVVDHHFPHLTFCCKSCNKFYWDLTLLKKHRITNKGCIREPSNQPLICDQCGASFIRPNQLKSHHKIYHLPKEQKPIFECYLCRSSYHARSGLKKHMHKHIGSKKVECTICHKLIEPSNIKCHYRYHSDIKPFNCSYCDKKFKDVKQLKAHERVHTGERPYKCRVTTCDYRCSNSANIYKHMRRVHKMTFGKQKESV